MPYIKFRNSNFNINDFTLTIIDNHTVELENVEKNLSGFRLYLDNDMMIGDYYNFTHDYCEPNKTVYTDDGHIYNNDNIEPLPILPNEPTLEEIIDYKLIEIKNYYNLAKLQERKLELSSGNDTFIYDSETETDIVNAFNTTYITKLSVPLYNSNKECNEYTNEDVIKIYIDMMSYTTYLKTLYHQLNDYIKELDDIDIVNIVTFDIESLDDAHKIKMNSILELAQANIDKLLGE